MVKNCEEQKEEEERNITTGNEDRRWGFEGGQYVNVLKKHIIIPTLVRFIYVYYDFLAGAKERCSFKSSL